MQRLCKRPEFVYFLWAILLVGCIFLFPAVLSAQEHTEPVQGEVKAAQQVTGHLPQLPAVVHDLGLILIAAAVMTLLFKWMRQPVVLGYLIAGFIVSEYFPPPSIAQHLPDVIVQMLHVKDKDSIHVWAEIGVIFMLFGLGLEFSFKKLLAVGRIAAITGGFEVCSTIVIGFFVGKLLGWNHMDSIFFGAMLAMSSTTIIVKVFDELNLKRKAFAPIVFGGLIVEDLLAILLLVLLSSIAISQRVAGGELLFASLKLVFFLVLWFIMGIFLLPWLLKKCRHLLNDELLLLVSVGLCFLMVIIACGVGFSSALGAFVMGSILAETSRGTRIEHVTYPVKNLFSAVFFVSVGMMINPAILIEYAGTISIIIAVTVIAKFFGTGFGALLAGCSVRNCMQAGMSMAQIGEFSFIIATLGKSLGVISDFLYPVAVAVSAVTTLTTPYLIKSSGPITNWLDNWIPERLHLLLIRYEVAMNESVGKENILLLFWRVHGLAMMLNTVVLVGIGLGGWFFVAPLLDPHPLTPTTLVLFAIAVLVSLPFLAGIFYGRPPRPDVYDAETLNRLHQLQFGVTVVRFFMGCVLVVFIAGSYLGLTSTAGAVASVCIVCFLFLFSRKAHSLYLKIERRFIVHLSDKERATIEDRSALPHLVPWEATLTEFTVSEYSPLVLQTVQHSKLKQDYGVMIAIIRRGEKTIVAPHADERLLPSDRLYLIGTYDQLASVQPVIEYQPEHELEFDDNQFGMLPFRLDAEHSFVGKTIRDCSVRDMVQGLIVGIEREGVRHLNPHPDMKMHAGDMLWLVGNRELIRILQRSTHQTESIIARWH